MYIDQGSFLAGLVTGLVFAGVLGRILGRINAARSGMRAPDRPMGVATTKTPRSVMESAAQAFRSCLLWSMLLVVVLAGGSLAIFWLVFGGVL